MKTLTVILSALLFLLLSARLPSLSAQSTAPQPGWTDQFLLNLKAPSVFKADAAAPPTPDALIGQVFQTGTIPISLQQVIELMVEHNLDIRTNRFGPRSTALQTLVFYRALLPSIRF